jgi:hypothetical protein
MMLEKGGKLQIETSYQKEGKEVLEGGGSQRGFE